MIPTKYAKSRTFTLKPRFSSRFSLIFQDFQKCSRKCPITLRFPEFVDFNPRIVIFRKRKCKLWSYDLYTERLVLAETESTACCRFLVRRQHHRCSRIHFGSAGGALHSSWAVWPSLRASTEPAHFHLHRGKIAVWCMTWAICNNNNNDLDRAICTKRAGKLLQCIFTHL